MLRAVSLSLVMIVIGGISQGSAMAHQMTLMTEPILLGQATLLEVAYYGGFDDTTPQDLAVNVKSQDIAASNADGDHSAAVTSSVSFLGTQDTSGRTFADLGSVAQSLDVPTPNTTRTTTREPKGLVASVPEPASMFLLGTGLLGVAVGLRRARRNRSSNSTVEGSN